MYNWFDVVMERTLFTFDGSLKVVIDLEGTFHSDQRQGERVVTDKEIIETAKKVIPTIMRELVNDEITMKDEYRIYNKETKLNIICQMRGPDLKNLKLVIITVIAKDDRDFKVKSGTKKTYYV
jgi:hypothetical protein